VKRERRGLQNASANSFGQSEVKNLHQAFRRNHDVGCFQVPVDDASIVRPSQRARDLYSVAQNRFRSESHLPGQAMERLAFDQFHDDVQIAVNLTDVINRADIRMSQGRGSPSLLQQILPTGGIEGCILLDNFDRHVAMEDFVVGAIYNPHTPFAYLGNHAAVAENFADHNEFLLHQI
jgi:hypothetical protein